MITVIDNETLIWQKEKNIFKWSCLCVCVCVCGGRGIKILGTDRNAHISSYPHIFCPTFHPMWGKSPAASVQCSEWCNPLDRLLMLWMSIRHIVAVFLMQGVRHPSEWRSPEGRGAIPARRLSGIRRNASDLGSINDICLHSVGRTVTGGGGGQVSTVRWQDTGQLSHHPLPHLLGLHVFLLLGSRFHPRLKVHQPIHLLDRKSVV